MGVCLIYLVRNLTVNIPFQLPIFSTFPKPKAVGHEELHISLLPRG